MSHYNITLENGECRQVLILKERKYKCTISGDASNHFLSTSQIREKGKIVETIDIETSYSLQMDSQPIIDEGHLFETMKLLRNPIVKLEKNE